jgi:hypothetical protein
MSRWFRFYDAVADDPKVQRLSAVLFRTWINVLCIASRNAGRLPKPADMAFTLRLSEKETALALAGLVSAGLIDKDENGFYPHNWNARQFKSDNVAERVRKHREKRRCNVTGNTPETETEADKKGSEAKASGGEPPDPVKQVIDLGVALLTSTGTPEKQARSLVGKWRKAKGDGPVLTALIDCRARAIAEPIEWLEKRLKSAAYISPSGYEYRGDVDAVIREAEKRADWGTYWQAKGDRDNAKAAA